MSRAHRSATAAILVLSLTTLAPAHAATFDVSPASGTHATRRVIQTEADWVWPVNAARDMMRDYHAPVTRYSAGHRGIDVRGEGDIFAPTDGTVSFVGFVVDRPVLSIAHGGGFVTSFEPVTSDLSVGDAVRRGQVVGTLASPPSGHDPPGASGRTVASHCGARCLHFGVRLHGEYLSPLALFEEISPAVLLPRREGSP